MLQKYRITLTTTWRREHTEYLYLETADTVSITQYDMETGQPASLKIGESVIFFDCDGVGLEKE